MSKFIADKLKNLFKSTPIATTTVNTVEIMKPSVVSAVASSTHKLLAPLKPHLPLIKFRKDSAGAATSSISNNHKPSVQTTIHVPTPPPTSTSGVKKVSTVGLPILEDWELPKRYRRRPIDVEEMDYINRGGPA